MPIEPLTLAQARDKEEREREQPADEPLGPEQPREGAAGQDEVQRRPVAGTLPQRIVM